jgi:hypothetical protein
MPPLPRPIARPNVCAAVALVLLAGTLPVAAQTFREADPGRTPGWVFTPTFVFSVAHDDNVTLAGHQAPTASDTLTVLTPVTDVQYRGRHNWIGAGYDGSWSVYHTLDQLNAYDQNLRFDSRHDLNRRVALLFHEQYSLHPTTDVVELLGVPFLRTGSRLNDARGEIKVLAARHTSISASYSHELVKFEENPEFAQFLHGGHAHAISGGLDQQLSPRFTLGAHYNFRRAIVADEGGQFDMMDGSGTFSYEATPSTTVSGSLGIARLTDTKSLTTKTGPSWSASVEQRLARATASAAYVRSYVPSFGLGGMLQNQEFTANVRMPLSRNRLYWQGGLAWRRNEPVTTAELPLKSLWFQTWVGYAVERWLRIEGYYWRSQQDSQAPGGRVDRDRVGIQLVTARPMRIQ